NSQKLIRNTKLLSDRMHRMTNTKRPIKFFSMLFKIHSPIYIIPLQRIPTGFQMNLHFCPNVGGMALTNPFTILVRRDGVFPILLGCMKTGAEVRLGTMEKN